jgi:acyl transferase domain-containing protein
MALEKGYIPPNANFEKPNKDIDMDGLNIQVRRYRSGRGSLADRA